MEFVTGRFGDKTILRQDD